MMTEKETLNGDVLDMESAKKLDDDDDDVSIQERETWSSKIDFLLACVGYSVGFGNVWRFPYLCYKHGGGAFLVPYFLCVAIAGIPLFFMEVALGQFMRVGGHNAWRICPLFEGLGVASNVIIFFTNAYYNVIICWAFYYVFSSFASSLPWKSCGNWWNTEHCHDFNVQNQTDSTILDTGNSTLLLNHTNTTGFSPSVFLVDPVTEFWERKVLGISSGIEEPGTIKWDLALCLLFSWVVVYLCIFKGIKSSGKVLYVTATVPYLFMLALLIKNCLLEGAVDGVIYYLKPDVGKLSNIEVWTDAGTQIFWSYSIGIGALIALGSYNKFNHNSYRDVICFSLVNTGTSLLSGLLIFTILGHMSYQQNISIDKVAASGPGLAFIAYPKALSLLPLSPLWSALFFLMLILLGIDSQFVQMEGLITAIVDTWPHVLRRGYRKEIFVAIFCAFLYLLGLPMVTEGGMYVFQIFDYYSNNRVIMLIMFCECICISWIYGVSRFYDNIEMMLGRRINKYMWVMWKYFAPVLCLVMFVISVITYSELSYKRQGSEYQFPGWAVGFGWCLSLSSAVCVPGVAIYKLLCTGFSVKSLKKLLKPEGLLDFQLRPEDRPEIVHTQEEKIPLQ